MQFSDFKLNDNLLSSLMLENFLTPTQIQEKTLKSSLSGKDMLIKSVTGSGKTLTYVLPILNTEKFDGVFSLIVCPTRELVLQVKEQINKLNKNKKFNVVAVYGGSDFTRQRIALKSANIVIGTPGRLIDHIERRTLKLHKLKIVVLDEADEMLNMGFIEDIKTILTKTPQKKQTLMLSATFTDKIKELAKTFLKNPEIIETNVKNVAVKEVKQTYIKCLKRGKFETLLKFLTINNARTLVFVNTKKMAEELNFKLKKAGIESITLHGDLSQPERNRALNKFKNNVNVLIATDVLSRGLDINDIEFVINYDIPKEPEIYIHRIGRTARAGKQGMSLSLINSETQLNFLLENFGEYNLVELSIVKTNEGIVFVEKQKNLVQSNFAIKTNSFEKQVQKNGENHAKNIQKYEKNNKNHDNFNKNKKFEYKKSTKSTKNKSMKNNKQ